jgi:hypothetical protein
MSDSKKNHFTFYHFEIIYLFVIWNLLESIIYYISNDNKQTAMMINVIVFGLMSIILYINPQVRHYFHD